MNIRYPIYEGVYRILTMFLWQLFLVRLHLAQFLFPLSEQVNGHMKIPINFGNRFLVTMLEEPLYVVRSLLVFRPVW